MTADSRSLSYEAQLDQAKRFIEERDDFLVVSHVQPDGDAAASTLAVGWLLRRLGKQVTLINEGSLPVKFSDLVHFADVLNYSNQCPNRTYQSIITVDCADFPRIGEVASLFAPSPDLLNIDHHPTNDYFGTCQLIKPDAASTTQILTDLMGRFPFPLEVKCAECLYTGLLTDTGGFRYSSTTERVMQIAADLLALGVNGSVLAEKYLERMTYAQVELLKRALSTLTFSADRKIAWLSVTVREIEELQATSDDLDGLVNYARNIEHVEAGLLFKQRDEQTVKVSLRSNGQANVAEIAQSFGGGGHIRAAGCSVQGTLEEVINQVVDRVRSKLT
ncbi:bifunctional oligoribonuclease/PAP phosphatase NrnA [Paenibacillus larvae]